MAEIRGINIDIQATTNRFENALKRLLNPAKSLQKELEALDKQLKFNPKSPEMLQKRLESLKTTVKELTIRHNELNNVLESLTEKFNKGELEEYTDNYLMLKAYVEVASATINEFENEIKDTERAMDDSTFAQEKFGDSIEGVEKKANLLSNVFNDLGNNIKSRLTNEIINLVEELGNATQEIEYLESDLRALFGDNATASDIRNLTQYAKDLSTQTTYSATEIQKAMSFMARAGFDAEQTMQSVKSALDLAMATGEDSTALASIIADGLTAFQMGAEESSRFANVLAVVANETNAQVTDLGQSFKYAGALAGTFGYEVEDIGIALGIMASNGIKGSQAGTTLRSMFTRLATNTGKARDELESLGVTFFDEQGHARDFITVLEEMREAMANMSEEELTSSLKIIGGQNAITGLTSLISATEDEWQSLKLAVQETGGYIERVAEIKVDNLQSDITKLKNSFTALGTDVLGVFTPLFRGAVQGLTDLVERTREGLNHDIFGDYIASTKDAVENLDNLIASTNKLNTEFELNILRSKDEATAIDEIVSKLKDKNLTDEESIELQKELQQKLDFLNQTFGAEIVYNGRKKALEIEGETINNVSDGYENLTLEARKHFYEQQYAEVMQTALQSTTTALDNFRNAQLQLDKTEASLTDKNKELWETYKSLSGNVDALSNLYGTLDNDQLTFIANMVKQQGEVDNLRSEWEKLDHASDGIVEGFKGIQNATTEEGLTTAITNFKNELDFTEQNNMLDGYKQSLEEIQLMLANPEKYGLTDEEVKVMQEQLTWLENKIKQEEAYQEQLKKESEIYEEVSTKGKGFISDLYNNEEDGALAVTSTFVSKLTESLTGGFSTSFSTAKTDFATLFGELTALAEGGITIPIKFTREGFSTGFSYGDGSGSGSGGYGSGGFNSRGITVNASFNISGADINRNTAVNWGYDIANAINEALGREI